MHIYNISLKLVYLFHFIELKERQMDIIATINFLRVRDLRRDFCIEMECDIFSVSDTFESENTLKQQ